MLQLVCRVLVFTVLCGSCGALIERLYCGKHNCYELLEVSRDANASEIRKAYRKQAVRYHPDKNKEEGARERFELVSTAYEILKDEDERNNYNYMLDHPEEVYSHYYRYYRRRTPQVDVRLVLLGAVLVISLVQYVSWWHSHQAAVSAALRMPQYRSRAKELAQSRGLLGNRRRSGKEGKAEEEAILRGIVEENLDVTGGYRKPHLLDVFLFRIIILPYTMTLYLRWYMRWVWLFNIKGEPYGNEELEYLTRKSLQLSVIRWEAIDSAERAGLVTRQLWVKENHTQWTKEKEEEQKVRLAESSKHKMYRRYKKFH